MTGIPDFGFHPRVNFIPSDFLKEGQRIEDGDTLYVSRAEYDTIEHHLTSQDEKHGKDFVSDSGLRDRW